MKKESIFSSVKNITLIAMLTAMSVVIAIFCKSVLNFGGGLLRISFESLPIILSGILFGPVAGGFVGLSADLIGYFLSGQAYPINILVTVGSASIGIVSGFIAKYVFKKRSNLQIILSGALAHAVGSMTLKTVGLFQFYGWAVLVRVPIYLVICALEVFLLCILFNRSGFRRLVDGVDASLSEETKTESEEDKE